MTYSTDRENEVSKKVGTSLYWGDNVGESRATYCTPLFDFAKIHDNATEDLKMRNDKLYLKGATVNTPCSRLKRLDCFYWFFSEHRREYQSKLSTASLCRGRKTLVAPGQVITYNTSFSTGVESTNNFCPTQLKRKKGDRWSSLY